MSIEHYVAFRDEQFSELKKFKKRAENLLSQYSNMPDENKRALEGFIKIVESALKNRSNMENPETTYGFLIRRAIELNLFGE